MVAYVREKRWVGTALYSVELSDQNIKGVAFKSSYNVSFVSIFLSCSHVRNGKKMILLLKQLQNIFHH